MTFRMLRQVALYGIITIRFPPDTISETIGNDGLEDVIALRFSRISETTLDELRYTTSVEPSRSRNLYMHQSNLKGIYISPYCSAHFLVNALAPNGGNWKLFPTKGNPLGPGGNTYFLPRLSLLVINE